MRSLSLPLSMVLALAVTSSIGCSKAGEESGAKRSPSNPPPQSVDVPADLKIPVEVDGKPVEPITHATLSALKPDFADGERSAWRLTKLLGAAFTRPGAIVEAASGDGLAGMMAAPATEKDPQPVLYLTRRGDVVIAMLSPGDPFPKYHGQGGRLRRPGDPRPRIASITKLKISISAGGRKGKWRDMEAAGKRSLSVLKLNVDGKAAPMTDAQLDAIPTLTIRGDQGDRRVVWSLRDLAGIAGGADSRVTKVIGDDEVEIDAAAWADAKRTPVLRVNRRGEIKFQWIGHDGVPSEDGQVREVMSLELHR